MHQSQCCVHDVVSAVLIQSKQIFYCEFVFIAEEAWLLKPLEASAGDQPSRIQVDPIWPIHLLWESLHLPPLSDISDSIWSCSPQSFGGNMLAHLMSNAILLC